MFEALRLRTHLVMLVSPEGVRYDRTILGKVVLPVARAIGPPAL